MRTNRLKMVGAATVGALALSVTGLAGTAQADLADDLQIMAGNIPAAVDAMVEYTQVAFDTFEAGGYGYPITQLSFDLAYVLQAGVNALTAGTEQFGSLGLGLATVTTAPLGLLIPQLMALDEDPASVLDTIDPNDVAILIGNLPAALAAAQPWVIETVASALVGNLTEGEGSFPGVDTPAVIGSAVAGLTEGFRALIPGTNLADNGADYTVGGVLLVPAVAVAGYAKDLEEGLAPVFDALAPVTGPIAEALAG